MDRLNDLLMGPWSVTWQIEIQGLWIPYVQASLYCPAQNVGVRLDKPLSRGLASSVMRQLQLAKNTSFRKFCMAVLDSQVPGYSIELVLKGDGDFGHARI